jgi:hypothetical protein
LGYGSTPKAFGNGFGLGDAPARVFILALELAGLFGFAVLEVALHLVP